MAAQQGLGILSQRTVGFGANDFDHLARVGENLIGSDGQAQTGERYQGNGTFTRVIPRHCFTPLAVEFYPHRNHASPSPTLADL